VPPLYTAKKWTTVVEATGAHEIILPKTAGKKI
jgi:hypothetical protein